MEYVAPERIEPQELGPGERRALTAAAHTAIASYDIPKPHIELMVIHSNAVFSVASGSGDRYVLRVGMPASEFGSDINAEMAWLLGVRQGTELSVVEPVSTLEGKLWTEVPMSGEVGPRRCVLFRHEEGRPLTECVNEANYRTLGAAAATLHEFGARWPAPDGLRPMVWDRVFYLPGEGCCLFDEPSRNTIPEQQHQLLTQAIEIADAGIRAAAPDAHYIHGDLHMRNVLVNDHGLTVLDFEDVMIASPAQDIAVGLHYGRDRDDYERLVEAYRGGYEEVRPWPATSYRVLETFMAARSIMQLNHALAQGWNASAFSERVIASLERFVRDG
jgi:Ser/Thr protein kinase RdoA (MazF antagonist)